MKVCFLMGSIISKLHGLLILFNENTLMDHKKVLYTVKKFYRKLLH